MKVKILIDTIPRVKEFVQIAMASKIKTMDITNGRHTVDAKSIMGLFSLNLSNPVDLVIECEDDIEIENFTSQISDFIV